MIRKAASSVTTRSVRTRYGPCYTTAHRRLRPASRFPPQGRRTMHRTRRRPCRPAISNAGFSNLWAGSIRTGMRSKTSNNRFVSSNEISFRKCCFQIALVTSTNAKSRIIDAPPWTAVSASNSCASAESASRRTHLATTLLSTTRSLTAGGPPQCPACYRAGNLAWRGLAPGFYGLRPATPELHCPTRTRLSNAPADLRQRDLLDRFEDAVLIHCFDLSHHRFSGFLRNHS